MTRRCRIVRITPANSGPDSGPYKIVRTAMTNAVVPRGDRQGGYALVFFSHCGAQLEKGQS